jgi:hypothetical protein
MNLKFGKTYMVCAAIKKHRTEKPLESSWHYPVTVTTWVREALKSPTPMLFIGKRHVADGEISLSGDPEDSSPIFYPTRRFAAALFVQNERTNPVYVLLEDVSEVEYEHAL